MLDCLFIYLLQYTYTGPKEIPGFDPYESTNEETNMHTEV